MPLRNLVFPIVMNFKDSHLDSVIDEDGSKWHSNTGIEHSREFNRWSAWNFVPLACSRKWNPWELYPSRIRWTQSTSEQKKWSGHPRSFWGHIWPLFCIFSSKVRHLFDPAFFQNQELLEFKSIWPDWIPRFLLVNMSQQIRGLHYLWKEYL